MEEKSWHLPGRNSLYDNARNGKPLRLSSSSSPKERSLFYYPGQGKGIRQHHPVSMTDFRYGKPGFISWISCGTRWMASHWVAFGNTAISLFTLTSKGSCKTWQRPEILGGWTDMPVAKTWNRNHSLTRTMRLFLSRILLVALKFIPAVKRASLGERKTNIKIISCESQFPSQILNPPEVSKSLGIYCIAEAARVKRIHEVDPHVRQKDPAY